MISQLIYNEDTERLEFDGDGLHCWQTLKVLIISKDDGAPEWVSTRLEMSRENGNAQWYLVGLWGFQANGLFAKLK